MSENRAEKAQKRRADLLRERIAELEEANSEKKPSRRKTPQDTPVSPREFVHKRMRELQDESD